MEVIGSRNIVYSSQALICSAEKISMRKFSQFRRRRHPGGTKIRAGALADLFLLHLLFCRMGVCSFDGMVDTCGRMMMGAGPYLLHRYRFYFVRLFADAGAGYRRGVGFTFIKTFIALAVIAEKVAKTFGGIDVPIVVVAKGNDRCIFVQHANKNSAIAVPPAIVIDELFTIGDHQHAPTQAIISLAGLFKTISCIGPVQDALGEKLARTQGIIPLEQVPNGG